MKVLGIILICFISFTTNATNLFYYSSFECLFDLCNLTIHKDGDFSKSKEINQSFIIKFEDIASYYDVSSSTATVVYLNDKNKEIKKSDIIVIQETDMLSFVEGRSFSELKPQYRTQIGNCIFHRTATKNSGVDLCVHALRLLSSQIPAK